MAMTVVRTQSRWKVVLYIPNLLCYARILLAFIGQHYAGRDQAGLAIRIWILSAVFDLFDGPAARVLQQTSQFGVLMDIIADNVLRTTVWMAVANVSSASIVLQHVALAIVCLEWLTLVVTQLHAAQKDGEHWKKTRGNDPWFIRVFFANNFRNPLGTWGVLGLFCANLFLYGMHYEEVYSAIPRFRLLLGIACVGRVLSMMVELRLCFDYLVYVLDEDCRPPVPSHSTAAKND